MKKIYFLVIVFFITFNLFSQNKTSKNAQTKKNPYIIKNPDNTEVILTPDEGQSLITNTTIKFQALIQGIRPGQIMIENPAEIEDVVFKSLRRMEEYSEEGGTRIEVSLVFKKSGNYELTPLTVQVKGKMKKIPFESLTIKPNPMELAPILSVNFKSGEAVTSAAGLSSQGKIIKNARTGEKIYFTLKLQYAVQLVQYDWELPKDSIFTELKRYEITEIKTRDKVYSEELVPVADFEWIPLTEGRLEFPQFKITATSYNGIKQNLTLPQFYINVTKGKTAASGKNNEPVYFDDAFTYDVVEENAAAKIEITDSICEQIAALRSKERNSLSFSAVRERAEYEKSLNLPYEQKEFRVILFILAVVMVIAAGVFLVLFIYRKMPLAYIFMGVLEVCSIVFMIYTIVQSSARHGISRGCKIYSIPEEKAEAKSEIPAGNRITITEESGNWIYVELGENGGWCVKDDVIEIK